jgi:hypothetical protein
VQRHVLAFWRSRVAASSIKWQQLARALCFHKHTLQTTALRAWQQAAAQQQQAREAAAVRLQAWQQQMLRCSTAEAVAAWHEVAREQKELRLLAAQLVHILQRHRKQQVRPGGGFQHNAVMHLCLNKYALSRHDMAYLVWSLATLAHVENHHAQSVVNGDVLIMRLHPDLQICPAVRPCQVLLHWSGLVQYHRQLGAAAERLAATADWWWLRHCLGRWQAVAAAMAGRRSAELREVVLLRAVLG